MFPDLDKITNYDLDDLAILDSGGLLIAPGEDIDVYKKRIAGLLRFRDQVENDLSSNGNFELDKDFILPQENRIPDEIINEAAQITEPLYAFSVRWVPGFFLSQSLGLLWGGCSFTETGSDVNVFLIRGSFALKPRWFIYRRDELIAHELCHAARNVMEDEPYEEYFAYQTSPFKGRRYLGACFRTRLDALLFLGPVMLLLIAEITRTVSNWYYPIYPFWLAAMFYPFFLLLRNQFERSLVKIAEKKLRRAGIARPQAILFRSVSAEIHRFAMMESTDKIIPYINQLAANELRWRLIKYRFIEKEEQQA